MAFLDGNGVTTLVTRLKTYFALKTDIPTVPTAYTSNPKMDGTASAGSGTTYARGNHVHPHDTSKQDALVSGTNIKTINGESILGSGDITVGGGGGGSSFLISMTYDGSSISNVSYNGATATEIAQAIKNDHTTRVVFALNVGSGNGVMYCTPSTIQASYNADWGDIATSIRVVAPMWFDDAAGDMETYLLKLTYRDEKWSATKRTTI